MLYTVKQYINLFDKLLLNSLYSNARSRDGSTSDNINLSKDKEKYIIDNEEDIINFIKKLDSNDDGIIKNNDTLSETDKTVIKNILSVVGINFKNFENHGAYTAFLETKIKEFVRKKKEVIIETKEKIKNEKKSIKTSESVVKGSKGKMLGFIELKSNREDVMGDVNISSLNKLLKKEDLKQLISDLENSLSTTNLIKYEFSNYGGRNYKPIIKILEKAGYNINGYFGLDEAIGVIGTICLVNETQEKIPSLGFKQKLGIIFDYNFDGILDNDVHFYTKEKEIFKAVETKKEFENMLYNLGYNGLGDFNSQFQKNYFAARSEFKTRIGDILGSYSMIDPGKFLSNKNAIKDHLVLVEANKDLVEDEMAKMVKFDKIREKDKKLYEKIKLQAVGVLVGNVQGIGIGFNIKEVTKGILDSVQIGFFNGFPGFGITKNIVKTENDRLVINVGAINFVPYIAGAVKLEEGKIDEMKEMFPNEIGTKTAVTLGGAFSVISAVGLDFTKVDEKTQNGMKQMKEQMGRLLNKIFEKIKLGTSFEKSGFEQTSKNREVYERLSSLYESTGATEASINMLKKGALNNYERHLYEQVVNKGIVFTGVYVGMATLYPIIGIHGEKHSIKWKQISKARPIKKKKITRSGVTKVESIQVKEIIDINTYNKDAIEKTKEVNGNISKLLHSDALKSRNTPGMMAFQKSMFEYNKGNKEIADVWKEFIKVFSEEKMIKYAKSHKNEKELEFIKTCFLNKNDLEKNLILKNVAVNLMKKKGMEFKEGGKIGLRGLTLKEYNKKYNRTSFFNKLFKKELPDLADRIASARYVYLFNNRDVKEYGSGIAEDIGGIGFSGVEVRKTKETGVNSYAGGYRYAIMPKMSFVPIPGRSKDLINRLPDLVVENFRKQLVSAGIKLESLEDVKNYINNEKNNVGYGMFFAKDPECLNDKVIIKNLTVPVQKIEGADINGKIEKDTVHQPSDIIEEITEKSISTYGHEVSTKVFSLAAVLDEIKKDDGGEIYPEENDDSSSPNLSDEIDIPTDDGPNI